LAYFLIVTLPPDLPMNRSDDRPPSVTETKSAVQQSRAPRPLPLFLELVRMVSKEEPELAAKALDGLAKYEAAPRPPRRQERPVCFESHSTIVRDCGGSGSPLILVPSLINPPSILDLDQETSLADAVARMGRHAFLIDWGRAEMRRSLDVADCVEMLAQILGAFEQPPAVVGYCLGGTMVIAAANLVPVERVATLASPWKFSAYPARSRVSLEALWSAAGPSAAKLGLLPMEILQSAFWSLDPLRTVSKFAAFADLLPESSAAQRFVTLEDWANEGEPLPYPAARELLEDLFARDLPGNGQWKIGDETVTDSLDCPLLNITASADRITPAETASAGDAVQIESGHVGMIVGSSRTRLHEALANFVAAPCR
jgi:polyhydroxyalkanoate synthase